MGSYPTEHRPTDQPPAARPAWRIVFMGTADFAVPSLQRLTGLAWATIAGVVTQPPRPAGRGRSLVLSPVHRAAEALGLPVATPERLRRPPGVAQVRAWQPELCVIAAYGQLLSAEVLAIPAHGCLNIHASLLPRHRGASPITGALLAGDQLTGVSIMLMDVGLDTGPVLATVDEPIAVDDTTATLTERLARRGADLLVDTAADWLGGRLTPRPQDEAKATLTRPLRKDDGDIDWTAPAQQIERQVRAYLPWPTAYTMDASGARLTVLSARVHADAMDLEPGAVGRLGGVLVIGAGQGALEPVLVQPAGRRPMPFADYLRGRRGDPVALRFGSTPSPP